MKINEVTKVLDNLSVFLKDLSGKTADGLTVFTKGMAPFGDVTVEQFLQFLQQCEEYKRNGVVATGKKPSAPKSTTSAQPLGASEAASKFRLLLSEIHQGTVNTARIDALMNEFDAGMKKPALDQLLTMLDMGVKSKTKADAIDKLRTVLISQAQMQVKTANF